jgi:voltage-gated potassium channel
MQNHVIVCGFGRVGTQVAAELAREGVPVVVIDPEPEAVRRVAEAGHVCVQGDAADDDCLREAGIERARGLVATTSSDASNVYVTLAARSLRPDLYIVARMDGDEAAPRLKKAGANRVISPYHLGGRRMASLVLRPAAVDFIDTALRSQQGTLQLEEVQVQVGARFAGATIGAIRQQLGAQAVVLAVIKQGGDVLANPAAPTVVAPGDVLIMLGQPADLRVLERNCGRPQDGATGSVAQEAAK